MAAPGGSAHGHLHAALARQPTSKRKGSARLLRLPSPTASCRPVDWRLRRAVAVHRLVGVVDPSIRNVNQPAATSACLESRVSDSVASGKLQALVDIKTRPTWLERSRTNPCDPSLLMPGLLASTCRRLPDTTDLAEGNPLDCPPSP